MNVHSAVSTSGDETKISKSNPGKIMLASRAFTWWVGFTRDLLCCCCVSDFVKAVNTDQRPAGREIQGLEHNPVLDTGCICSKSSKFHYAQSHTNGVWDANFLLTFTVAQWTLCSTQHSHVLHTTAPSQTPVLAVHEGQGLEREMTRQTPAIQTRNTASHSPLICCGHNTIRLVPSRQFTLSQTLTISGLNPMFTTGGFVDVTTGGFNPMFTIGGLSHFDCILVVTFHDSSCSVGSLLFHYWWTIRALDLCHYWNGNFWFCVKSWKMYLVPILNAVSIQWKETIRGWLTLGAATGVKGASRSRRWWDGIWQWSQWKLTCKHL